MPTFDEYEESRALAAPIELFKFETEAAIYRFTSDAQAHTVLGGVYEPEPVARSNLVQTNGDAGGVQLEVTLPASLRMITDLAFDYAPPEGLELTVYRFHDDDLSSLVIYWRGEVSALRVEGELAKLVVPSSLSNAVSGSFPGKFYQSPCNHTLFDERCGVSRAAHAVTLAVSSFTPSSVTLASVPPGGPGHYSGGEVVHLDSGERRMIASSTGDSLEITYPFRSLRAGDLVEIVPGCDHSPEACLAKFNNVANALFFPFIPSKNVFRSGLN